MTRIGGSIPVHGTGAGLARTTSTPPLSNQFRNALSSSAGAVQGTVGAVAPFVPGGAVVSAAVSSATGVAQTAALNQGNTMGSSANIAGLYGGAGGAAGSETGQSEMMQMLKLQRAINLETQQFTAQSNVMAARHHAAKAAVDNIR